MFIWLKSIFKLYMTKKGSHLLRSCCCCLLSSSIWTVRPSAQCYSIIGAGSNQLFKR